MHKFVFVLIIITLFLNLPIRSEACFPKQYMYFESVDSLLNYSDSVLTCYYKNENYSEYLSNYNYLINALQYKEDIELSLKKIHEYQDSISSFINSNKIRNGYNYKINVEYALALYFLKSDQNFKAKLHFENILELYNYKEPPPDLGSKIRLARFISDIYSSMFRHQEALDVYNSQVSNFDSIPIGFARTLIGLSSKYLSCSDSTNAIKLLHSAIKNANETLIQRNYNINSQIGALTTYASAINIALKIGKIKFAEKLINEGKTMLNGSNGIDFRFSIINYHLHKNEFKLSLTKLKKLEKIIHENQLNSIGRIRKINLKYIEIYFKSNKLQKSKKILLNKIIHKDLQIKTFDEALVNSNSLINDYYLGLKIYFKEFDNNKYVNSLDTAFIFAHQLNKLILNTRNNLLTTSDKTLSTALLDEIYQDMINVAFLKGDLNTMYKFINDSKFYSLNFQRLQSEAIKNNLNDSQLDSLIKLNKEITELNANLENNPQSYDILKRKREQFNKFANEISNLNNKETTSNTMPNNTCLITYYLANGYLYICIKTQSDIHIERIEINQDSLRNKIFNLKNKFNDNYKTDLRYLSKKLIPEVELPKYIVLIPHKFLNNLPFEALYDFEEEQLINNHTVSYHYSDKQSSNYSARKNVKISGLAPQFDKSCTNFEPLNYNTLEIQEIKSLFNNFTEAKNSNNYLKEDFISDLSNNDIYHLASHALLNNDNPYLSFISLGVNCADVSLDDKRVYLKDIITQKLDNEMIVLSSCESGNGKLQPGEGLSSLSKAFFTSNVKSIVSTLWSVNDNCTAEIMGHFYHFLSKGKRKDDALRLAKIKFLEEAGSDYKNPYYWAAFTPIGNMRPIAKKENRLIYYLLACLIAGSLALMIKKKISRKAA